MLRILKFVAALLVVVALPPVPASAQVAAPPSSPVSIAGSGGLAAASRGNGVAISGSLAFDLTNRFVLEAEGSHLGRGAGASVMTATASLLVNLLPAGGKTVPYLAMGGGLYRASFNLDHERFFGGLTGQFPAGTVMIPIEGLHGFAMMQGPYTGPPMWTGPWTGATYGPDHMPVFYVDRLGRMMVPPSGRWGMRSFTDPALSVGGGVRLAASPRLTIRPDARALVVIANGARYVVGVISVGIAYRF